MIDVTPDHDISRERARSRCATLAVLQPSRPPLARLQNALFAALAVDPIENCEPRQRLFAQPHQFRVGDGASPQ